MARERADKRKINIAIAGGPCTGKSTLAAALFAELKFKGFDYDLLTEDCRKFKNKFIGFRNPFERFYMWRQQERQEFRSNALDGFITDNPLFHYYAEARQYAKEPKDELAVKELFHMCLEIQDRYRLIVMAKNPAEIPYKKDQSRKGNFSSAREKHRLVRSFVEHFWPEKLLLVDGSVKKRVSQVIKKLKELKSEKNK